MVRFMERLVFVKQEEKNDSGVAALEAILVYYGSNYSLKELKEIISYNDEEGINVLDLYLAANVLGFKSMVANLKTYEYMEAINLPCIARLMDEKGKTYFVVVYKVLEDGIIISDSKQGIRKMLNKDFEKVFTGKILIILK